MAENPPPQKKRTSLKGGPLRKESFGFSGSETLLDVQRKRRLDDERRRNPELQNSHRNAFIFLLLGVAVHILILGGQMNMTYHRGMVGRFAMAVQISFVVAAALMLCASFAKFRKPWVPSILCLLIYIAYIPAAILIDHETGTVFKLLMAIAVIAFLRALASAHTHRKVHRVIYPEPDPTPPS